MVCKKFVDVDDSGDIPIAMLLRERIRFSPIVNPFILNILFVYSIRLQVVIPWSPQVVLKTGPRFELLYLFTPRCMYCRLVQVGMFTLHSTRTT